MGEKEGAIKRTALLRRRILSRQANVAVVGQGYVGLSVACAAAAAGFTVVGVDVEETRVEALNEGRNEVPGVSEATFRAGIADGKLTFTTAFSEIASSDVILICVPTPVRDQVPDLSFIETAIKDVALNMNPGVLVVLESTTYPGTTDELVRPLLETSGLIAGRDFLLAYSPERIDPGNERYAFNEVPRVVGGCTPEATGVASLFYGQLVGGVVSVSSPRAAELAKLLENTFRHVNIALVNEMAVLCHELGIDVWEVIDAAASKPFGFMPFYPGPGVGGHCIPLDPTYLAWLVRRDVGQQFRMVEQAQDINAQMPRHVATRIGEALNDLGRPLKGAAVLVLGVSYKADVGDPRESPAVKVIAQLRRRGAKVSFYDPYITHLPVNGDVLEGVSVGPKTLSDADCVALLTPHRLFDLNWIAKHARLVFDGRNAYGSSAYPNVVRL